MVVHASLWRVVVYTLILASLSNILLYRVSADHDAFANIIAVAAAVSAVGLIVTYHRYRQWLGEALLLTFATFAANAIEFATEDFPNWDTKTRQCGFYASFALLALGAYVAQRESARGR